MYNYFFFNLSSILYIKPQQKKKGECHLNAFSYSALQRFSIFVQETNKGLIQLILKKSHREATVE